MMDGTVLINFTDYSADLVQALAVRVHWVSVLVVCRFRGRRDHWMRVERTSRRVVSGHRCQWWKAGRDESDDASRKAIDSITTLRNLNFCYPF